MSLTSYQAAPPRALKILSSAPLRKSKNTNVDGPIAFAFLAVATSLTCGRKNPYRHGELVGPGFCRAVVSEEDAGERAARLVRAALRIGRGKLYFLFRTGTANGRALVRSDAG